MKFKVSSIAIAVGASSLLLAGAASAQQPTLSYNYLEGNVTQGEIDGFDYTTYGAELSIAIGDTFFLKGTAAEGESDDRIFNGPFSGKVDIKGYSLGLGAHLPITARTDFVTGVSYVKNELGFRGFNQDADGVLVELGIRSMLTDSIELEAGANYIEGDDFNDKIGFNADARFYLSPRLSLSAGYAERDKVDGINVGLRYNF